MDLDILRKYKKVIFRVACIIFLLGLVDLLVPIEFRKIIGNTITVDYRNNIPSVKSVFEHPNIFGWFTSFIALYCFAEFYFSKKKTYLFYGIAFFIGCFFSMRFKALSGLIAALIIGLVFLPTKKKLKNSIVIILFLIVIIIFLGPSISELFQTKIEQYLSEEAQFTIARNLFYIKSVTIARDYFPFGVGLGRYGSYLSRMYYSPIYVKYGMSKIWGLSKKYPYFINDTFWPMVLGESGFIGFFSYLVILFIIGRTIYRELYSSVDIKIKTFYLGTLMILIESLLESIAAPVYTGPPQFYFIFSAIGICYAFKKATIK